MPRSRSSHRGLPRTNEARIACVVRLIVYTFSCDDCGMRWLKRYTEDKGESYARSTIRHRCSRKLLKSKETE
jgi:hypothetical protein